MKIKFNKKLITSSSILALVLVIFLFSTKSTSAKWDWGINLLGTIVSTIVSGLGWILSKLIGVLVYIAQYNDFIRSGAVTNGWMIARDISNMFFVVILLIIAFATILRVESYSYKKWLPKLILMAVLINFSKTICGLFIDLAQVIMLTFVNAFKDVGAGNLVDILGIKDWHTLKDIKQVSGWEVMASFFLALIYVIIALITVAAMIGMLVMRIIMIWVYVVLSPFAYLLSAFPGGQKYAAQWWSEFTKNLIVGPVLAFFIWLSFASLSNMNSTAGSTGLGSNLRDNNAGKTAEGGGDITDPQAGEFGTSDLMVKFIVSIAMLIGGMKIASEIGGEAGSIAGKGLGKVKTWGAAGAGAVGGFALAKAKGAGAAVGGVAKAGIGTGLGYVDRGIGNFIDKKTGTTNFSGRGLVSTTAGMIATAPGKATARIRSAFAGSSESQEINKALRKYRDDATLDSNALMEFKNKKYKKNAAGKMEEFDDKANTFTGNILKDSSRGNREVSAMNASAAAMYDSVRSNFAPMTAKVDNKQAEAVDASQKNFAASGMNNDEMMRAMKSAGTSAVDKMALAMILATKGAFKNLEDVKEAKKYIGTNSAMSDKFDDEMDKKRPDLNYDFDNELDVANFKKRLDSGKIKTSEMASPAFKNGKMLSVIQDHQGDEFGKTTQSVASRGKKYQTDYAEGLGAMKVNLIAKESSERAAGKIADADKTKKAIQATSESHAKLTGEWQVSFADSSSTSGIDTAALGKFISGADAKALNKISLDDYKNLAKNQDNKNAVINNISAAKLVAMLKEGSNDELVTEIVRAIDSKNRYGLGTMSPKQNAILTNIQLTSLL